MKRFLLSVLAFFAAVTLVDLGVGLAGDYLRSHAKGGRTKAFDDLVAKDTHDVLILGSSRALHHYDTPFLSDTLGVDVYNAGQKGNGIIFADGVLEMVLKRGKPRLVLVDIEPAFDLYVSPEDHADKRYISLLKSYYRDPDVGNILKDVSREEWIKAHSGMFRYNTCFLTMLSDYLAPKETPRGGYVPLHGVMTAEPPVPDSSPKTLDSLKLKYLRRVVSLSRSAGVPLVFAASPKYASEDDFTPLKELCEEEGILFLDYHDCARIVLHKELFQEAVHLNADGARAYSRLVANDIRALIK